MSKKKLKHPENAAVQQSGKTQPWAGPLLTETGAVLSSTHSSEEAI